MSGLPNAPMQRRHLLLSAGALALPALAQPTPRLRVVASFSILADMVREVAGDAAEVTSLVGPNTDAHSFQPTPADAQRLAQAELVVVNGLGFEGWMERLIQSTGHRGTVVVASRGIAPRKINGADDPHAWQSLVRARRYVDNIRAALVQARPAQAAAIDTRAADYLRRIDALAQHSAARFAAVAPERRRVVTSHDAFGYFGDAFGITFIAPQGWTTDGEASAADVARVVRQLREQRVAAVFVENMSDKRLVQGIAREARATVGGTLYADALSPPGTAADSYLKLYAHNVNAIATALSPP